MSKEDSPNIKLFISYSWQPEQHEKWVLELASALRQDGVDVILDKWDLKEGYDAHKFMERMVADKNVQKFAIKHTLKRLTKGKGALVRKHKLSHHRYIKSRTSQSL